MAIELLFFDGCPNYEAFLPRLRVLLAWEGVGDQLELRAVETAEAAEAEGFLGSPTLRIDQTSYGFSATPPDEWVLGTRQRRR